MLSGMRLCTDPSYYEGVPVLFWPWVFWQLLQIDLWVEQTGRAVYGAVCRRTGRVYVDFWEDDPNAEKPWTPEDLQSLLPNSPAWRTATHPGANMSWGALSLVYVSSVGAIRDLLRAVCTKGTQNSAQTQTSLRLPLELGLPPPLL